MKVFLIAPTILLVSCQVKTQSYPLMGKIYVSEMKQGFVGCSWKKHKVKTSEPLEGTLKFSTLNCPTEVGNKSDHERKFHITDNNQLKMSEQSGPILTLHKLNTEDAQKFMTQFLRKTRDKDCVIEDNGFGRWQTGFRKDDLIQRGYRFVTEEEYQALSSDERMSGSIELENPEFFPMEISIHTSPRGPLCGKLKRNQIVPNVFRVTDYIVFEYDRPLIENATFIDPGSIEYIE